MILTESEAIREGIKIATWEMTVDAGDCVCGLCLECRDYRDAALHHVPKNERN